MRSDLPSGTVTFCFTDVEGSTRLLHELGAEAYADVLAEHRRLIREACTAEGGVEVDTQGDAFFFAFSTATGALAAAGAFTEALASGPVQVRVGLHTGTPLLTEEGYVGDDVHRAARIAAAGHGGQVLVSASTAPLVELELTDLGEHRLKDLSAPERVYQLGDGDFPPLKSLYRTNLPVPATPFLGRERELAEVVGLLEGTRLLTLTGPGGTGKTRLALQAAAKASDGFPAGVYWVPLAPLRDPSLLVTTFAQALEVQEQPGVAIVESIVRGLASRRTLLVVDNCEHLADAVAELLRQLLEGCPSLVVAASSRERLGLRSERVYPVPPMAPSDGQRLFGERALAVAPDFVPDEHVAAICEAVDELPLAIELAAARVRSLSTQAIRELLSERFSLLTSRDRDLDERQRTLEATIAWSYDLLDGEEQRVLRALSVFAGGCTLEAAEAVAGADLDLLESLLDKSLIRHRIDEAGHDRYWMLETIREYAGRQLASAGEDDAARRAHIGFLASYLPPLWRLVRERDAAATATLDADMDNGRLALDTALDLDDADAAARLLAMLSLRWLMRGQNRIALPRVERYLALNRDSLDIGVRIEGDLSAEEVLRFSGEPQRARELNAACLELARRFPDSESSAFGLERQRRIGALLAHESELALWEGDTVGARTAALESLALREAFGTPAGIAHALGFLADVEAATGHWEEAGAHLARGARLMELADLSEAGSYRVSQAETELECGRSAQAARLLVEHLPTVAEGDTSVDVTYALHVAAQVLAVNGRRELAHELWETCERLMDESGIVMRPWERERLDRYRERYRSALPDDRELTSEPETHPAELLQRARETLRELS